MGKLNLYERPYHLNEDDVRWVQETLAGMTLEEKIGQVFFAIGLTDSDEDALAMVEDLHIGGIMYRPNQAEKLKRRNDKIQAAAKIPLLIAANLEAGGSGALVEGTPFGSQLQVAATGRVENARLLGDISGAEAASVGFNLAFAPVCDIDRNWRNPITNTRTYGSDPEVVRSMCSAYLDGISKHGVAVSIKHFPGDGCDERDQHLVTSVNDLSCEEWDATYGMIYRALIEQGAQTVMAGHIMQPAYSRYFSPGLKDSEQMPASCSKELIDGLLRTKLGFQGVVLTDAANMIGYCCAMERRQQIPATINAGVDMILFGKNLEEDIRYLTDAVQAGIVPLERLDEACTRILGLKASLGLHKKETFSVEGYADVVGCEAFRALAQTCADQAVTLVKDTQPLLPVTPDTHKRVWLFIVGDKPGFTGGASCKDWVIEALTQAGFEVDCYDSDHCDISETVIPMEQSCRREHDIIMYFSNVINASYQTCARIQWHGTVAEDGPYFVNELPTLFVSLGNPYGFVDVPMIRTIVNAYNASPYTVKAVVDRITGKAPFEGTSPVDPFSRHVWKGHLMEGDMGMRYKGVIFDLDGVICSTDELHYLAWKEIADRCQIPFDRELNDQLRGVSRMESLERILSRGRGNWTQEQKQQLAEEKNTRYRELLGTLSEEDILPGVPETLQALRAKRAGVGDRVVQQERSGDPGTAGPVRLVRRSGGWDPDQTVQAGPRGLPAGGGKARAACGGLPGGGGRTGRHTGGTGGRHGRGQCRPGGKAGHRNIPTGNDL